jgi:hypothetical protein
MLRHAAHCDRGDDRSFTKGLITAEHLTLTVPAKRITVARTGMGYRFRSSRSLQNILALKSKVRP